MDRNRRFAGKVAIVTAAGNGIGKASAIAFAREGAKVAIADIDADAGSEVVRSLAAEGHEAIFVRVDVRDEQQVERMLTVAYEAYGRLDIAHNNAGGGGPRGRSLTSTTRAAWDNGIALNLTSTWMCLKHEIPLMARHGGGAIVNTSSMSGLRVNPRTSPDYGAAKAAVVHLTRIAAVQHAKDRVRVNCVTPGVTASAVGRLDPSILDDLLAQRLIKRANSPEDVANAVLWLCSTEAEMVTGFNLCVEGGHLIT